MSFVQIPTSIFAILLNDPVAIVDSIDRLFRPVSEMTLGRKGAVTEFPVPFIGSAIGKSLGAGSSDNFMEKARRTVKGALEQVLDAYDVNDKESTVADLIAKALTDLLGNTLGILTDDVTVKYYEHRYDETETLIAHNNYTDELGIKSLMFEIPFGQTLTVELPPMNFDLGNSAFPLQIKTQATEKPTLNLEWSLKLAFGFDADDGFFLYTYRK